jgi:hypothetical protein
LPLRRNSSALVGPCMGAFRGGSRRGPRFCSLPVRSGRTSRCRPRHHRPTPKPSASGRGDATTIPPRGHHGGSGTVTFWIVQRPNHGKLSGLRLLGDNRATINYENDGAKSVGADHFSYVVKTSGDQVSSPAEVRIFVEEPPRKLQVPGRIEFDQIMAGESETRQLTITNEGGGLLEGRLTVSAPWQVAVPDYRVNSGSTSASSRWIARANCKRRGAQWRRRKLRSPAIPWSLRSAGSPHNSFTS